MGIFCDISPTNHTHIRFDDDDITIAKLTNGQNINEFTVARNSGGWVSVHTRSVYELLANSIYVTRSTTVVRNKYVIILTSLQ